MIVRLALIAGVRRFVAELADAARVTGVEASGKGASLCSIAEHAIIGAKGIIGPVHAAAIDAAIRRAVDAIAAMAVNQACAASVGVFVAELAGGAGIPGGSATNGGVADLHAVAEQFVVRAVGVIRSVGAGEADAAIFCADDPVVALFVGQALDTRITGLIAGERASRPGDQALSSRAGVGRAEKTILAWQAVRQRDNLVAVALGSRRITRVLVAGRLRAVFNRRAAGALAVFTGFADIAGFAVIAGGAVGERLWQAEALGLITGPAVALVSRFRTIPKLTCADPIEADFIDRTELAVVAGIALVG